VIRLCNNVLFCSGTREFHWGLEVAQLLLDEGVITDEHVAVQAFTVTMGMFAGAWEMHHAPWRNWFYNWFALCSSLRNQGTARQYRLLQGAPKSAGTGTAGTNFICPSESTLDRHKTALDYTEGPKPAQIGVFRELMVGMQGTNQPHNNHVHTNTHTGSDRELMIVRRPGCTNVLFWLAADSQMLAPSAWIRDKQLMGVRPPLTVAQCEELYRNKVRSLSLLHSQHKHDTDSG
jgi:hypothetical protein